VSDLYSGLSARFVLVDVLVPGRTNARLTRLKEYRSRGTENRSTGSTAPANPRPQRQSQHNVAERPVQRIQFLCPSTHHHTIQNCRTTTLRFPYSHRQSAPRTATDNSAHIPHPLHHRPQTYAHPKPTAFLGPPIASAPAPAHLHPAPAPGLPRTATSNTRRAHRVDARTHAVSRSGSKLRPWESRRKRDPVGEEAQKRGCVCVCALEVGLAARAKRGWRDISSRG
jgi:hypothetical protein